MNRLGLTPENGRHRAAPAERGPRLQAPDQPLRLRRDARSSHKRPADRLFRGIRILFRGMNSSLANSAGIFLGGTAHCDLVRPGIALYGGNPIPGQKNPMRPAVEFKGRIAQVR